RSAITRPRRRSMSASVIICPWSAWGNIPSFVGLVDLGRILQHGVDLDPLAALELPVEARLPPGVTGYAADLLDLQQHHVFVAIEPDRPHALHVAGLLPFAPELSARARPVVCLAGLRRPAERFAVHPRDREDPAARDLLRHRGHEAVVRPVHLVEPA